jgi:nucleoside-diphosphate-sugar epimerase
VYQYADDTASLFLRAARTRVQGAETFNVRGSTVHMREIVAAIERAAPAVRGKITFDDKSLPFPADTDDSRLVALLGALNYTPLTDGVRETVDHFRQLLQQGRLTLPA